MNCDNIFFLSISIHHKTHTLLFFVEDDSNKTVIKKLNRINLMMTSLYENGGQAVKQVPTFDSEDDELQMFPAATKEELLLIENKLKKSKRFSRKVVCILY